jgi:hypothetical protein
MCVKGLTSIARSWEKQRTKDPLIILLTITPDHEVHTKKPVIDIQHKVNSTHNKKIAEPHYSSIWASLTYETTCSTLGNSLRRRKGLVANYKKVNGLLILTNCYRHMYVKNNKPKDLSSEVVTWKSSSPVDFSLHLVSNSHFTSLKLLPSPLWAHNLRPNKYNM